MKRHSKIVGGVLLVTGTSVGAGMLALPVSTGMAGFIPSMVLLAFYCLYMAYTALLMLEVNLWAGEGNNLSTMIRMTLGKGGQIIGWALYLFLLYALTTAYIAGCGPIIQDAVESVFGFTYPDWAGAIPLLVIFGYFVYHGTHSVDRVNRILMMGLVIAFVSMVVFLTPHVKGNLLLHQDWKYIWVGVSVVATSYGFQIIIPSLVTYLDGDVGKLKKVILIGSFIPLFVYISWEFVTLGIIPIEGAYGIKDGFIRGRNGAHLLTEIIGHSAIAMIARFFSFFAIVTSFLGVSLSLFDFLADGLKIKKTHAGRALLCILTFLPPLLISLYDPRAFLSALEYAGAFGVISLLGLFPALMAWAGRYHKGLMHTSIYRTPGGKAALIIVILISFSVIALEVAIKSGILAAEIPQ